jgi:hypothetical protein
LAWYLLIIAQLAPSFYFGRGSKNGAAAGIIIGFLLLL